MGGSLADQAYDRFREGLRSGALQPGQRVLEVELAERLGMSRTPVREAIRRLQSEGLIAHLPARGLCVAAYDHAEVDELYGMREALEGTAARLAAQHAGRPDIALLQRLVEEEGRIPAEAAAEHNRRFHRALHQAAHNRYLLRALSSPQRRPAAAGADDAGAAGPGGGGAGGAWPDRRRHRGAGRGGGGGGGAGAYRRGA